MKMTLQEWFSAFKNWIPGLGSVDFLSNKRKYVVLTAEQKRKYEKFNSDINRLDPRVTCCCRCHFEYEEKFAFPYLPRDLRNELKREHEKLLEDGLPPKAVFAHAKKETDYFQRYLPDDKQAIMERIDTDHFKFWNDHVVVNATGRAT